MAILLIFIILILLFGATKVKDTVGKFFLFIFGAVIFFVLIAFIFNITSSLAYWTINGGGKIVSLTAIVILAFSIIFSMINKVFKWRYEKNKPRRGKKLLEETKKNRTEYANWLLKEDVDPNLYDENGRTPLFYAVENNNVELVQALLRVKADPNIRDQDGDTPLTYAELKGKVKIEKLLRDKGAKSVKPSVKVLCRCVTHNNLLGLRRCLKAGVNPNVRCSSDQLILNIAIENCKDEMVRLLLEYGAKPDIDTYSKAKSKGNRNIINEIQKYA